MQLPYILTSQHNFHIGNAERIVISADAQTFLGLEKRVDRLLFLAGIGGDVHCLYPNSERTAYETMFAALYPFDKAGLVLKDGIKITRRESYRKPAAIVSEAIEQEFARIARQAGMAPQRIIDLVLPFPVRCYASTIYPKAL